MEVTLVEGKKLNSFNYQSGGHLYNKVRSSQKFTYLRCTLNRSFGCPGYAKIDNFSNTLFPTCAHDHGEESYKLSEFSLRNKLKRAAETSSERLREVFNDVCSEEPLRNIVTFREIESSMCKRRRRLLPPLPKDAKDFSQLIVESPFAHLYRGTVNHDGAVAVIFASDFMLMNMNNADNIQFDGTFFTVPSIFYQLFTLFVSFHGHCIPAIFILMENKTEELYTAVILKLLELLPGFSPKLAVSDYEKAPRNAFANSFPEMKIIGCWFHFTQAVWNKTQKLGLGKLYKRVEEYANWLRRLMALPLLPQSEIIITFSLLEAQVFELSDTDNELINKLKKYFKKTWILGEKGLSLFSAEILTNNGC